MGYRSLKKVLGETNIERKCRWLFGLCLFVLVFVAFGLVDYIGERLVLRNTYQNGHEWVRTFLFDKHWETWETDTAFRAVQQKMSDELLGTRHEASVLTPDRGLVADMEERNANTRTGRNSEPVPRLSLARDAAEEEILLKLQREFENQLLQKEQAATVPSVDEPGVGSVADLPDVKPTDFREKQTPIFATRPSPEEGKFYYYEPVNLNEGSCYACHESQYGKYATAASDITTAGHSELPFVVVRVALPYDETRTAINRTRAILLAVGILTVFLSMVALWMVVRYVVIKPLEHLREVSDSVSRGDLQQRAEIHTNDEFEDLASSFNKMLRHLTEAQTNLQQANVDLDAKVDELAQLNMRLHEMNRLKGDFLATMSHELRTPLNSIIGFSEVLVDIDSLNDKQKRYAKTIQKSGRQLLDMINDILDLAKLEAGKMDLRLGEFRIETIISVQADMVRALTEEKNIDLQVDIEDDLPVLFQDQAKVQQILTNLLSNAIKFTPEGGRIVVGARGDRRGFVEIFVSDTGVGIAEADREVIFEKFRQGTVVSRDNLTREYSGTGLGLSIVKELCKLLGGEVSVDSELGKGSTFRVLIPWMKADAPQAVSKLNSKLDEMTKPHRKDFENSDGESESAAVGSGERNGELR